MAQWRIITIKKCVQNRFRSSENLLEMCRVNTHFNRHLGVHRICNALFIIFCAQHRLGTTIIVYIPILLDVSFYIHICIIHKCSIVFVAAATPYINIYRIIYKTKWKRNSRGTFTTAACMTHFGVCVCVCSRQMYYYYFKVKVYYTKKQIVLRIKSIKQSIITYLFNFFSKLF